MASHHERAMNRPADRPAIDCQNYINNKWNCINCMITHWVRNRKVFRCFLKENRDMVWSWSSEIKRIQHSLARVITNISKFQHIIPKLKKQAFNQTKIRLLSSCIQSTNKLTIVFHFHHILFLQDLLIYSFFPFHMSECREPMTEKAPLPSDE